MAKTGRKKKTNLNKPIYVRLSQSDYNRIYEEHLKTGDDMSTIARNRIRASYTPNNDKILNSN